MYIYFVRYSKKCVAAKPCRSGLKNLEHGPPSHLFKTGELQFAVRQCDTTCTEWLYFQRLHRCINSAVLISAQESAKEMLGIVKNGDFSRLFMKSTIRVCYTVLINNLVSMKFYVIVTDNLYVHAYYSDIFSW